MCVTLNLLLCGALDSGHEVVQRLLLNLVLERLPLRVSKQRRNSLYCRCSYGPAACGELNTIPTPMSPYLF